MAQKLPKLSLLLVVFLLISSFLLSIEAQSFLGVNYGQVADNLPPAEATVKLLKSTSISKVRLYGADPVIIKALANTGIGIVIGAANGDIPALATDPNHAGQWVGANVIPYYPASNIILITVGNEVITSGDQNLISQLVPAMQNIQNALNGAQLGGKIKVSTVNSMAVLGQSDPPSSGAFNSAYGNTMKSLLAFQKANGSPLTINPYPFFAYESDPRPETLAFCLFQPNAGRVDSRTNIKYMNMFDAQVDAVHSALNAMGYKDTEIVVAETGWPYRGDSNEAGASIENAKAYNGGLINHLRSMVGTPLMPGKSVDTYIFALYDEDLKPGPTSERSFGLFKPDLSMTYDVGLSKSSSQVPSTTPSTTPATPSPKPTQGGWCVPKQGVSDAQLQANLDYACGHGIDCSKIQPGGPCFNPNTVSAHAAYAMNLYYQTAGRNPGSCDFSQTAILTDTNPSYSGCVYPAETSKSSSQVPSTTPSTTPVTPSPKPTQGGWCVPKQGVSDAQLQANLDYACGHGIDCSKIQPGGPCFDPKTVASHAAYAMNLFYQTAGRNPWNCDFSQTATLTYTNPSYNGCVYPAGAGESSTRLSLGVTAHNSDARRNNERHWWWCYILILFFL